VCQPVGWAWQSACELVFGLEHSQLVVAESTALSDIIILSLTHRGSTKKMIKKTISQMTTKLAQLAL